MNKVFIVIGGIVLGLAIIFGWSLLIALPLMWLVNWLITPTALVAVFGVTKLRFWKAFGLLFLSGLLFKSVNTSNK